MPTASRRPGGRRLLQAVLAGALTAFPLVVLPHTAAAAPTAAASPASDPDAAALSEARRSGHAVVVDADTTPYAQVTANPAGTFTLTTDNAPQRVRTGTSWVPVDATLHRGADGRLSPAAAVSAVSLSGGGSGPLATFDDGAGHTFALTMPMSLPAPAIGGDTAVYSSILSGVDLAVTVTTEGGIREVLVVKNATAAADPALAQLRLAVSTTDLELTTGADGSINAVDPVTAEPIFTAPTPVMWDSTATAPAAKSRARSLTSAASTTTGPGENAVVTAVPDSVSAAAITLTPPAAALTGPGVTYPAYIDPSLTPSPSLNHKAYTQSYYPTRTEWNPTDSLRVGFDDWSTNCGDPCYKAGITRSFLNFTGLAPLAGKKITGASLVVSQASASCTSSETINVAITSGNAGFSSSLDWSNQPAASGVKDSRAYTGTDSSYTTKLVNIGPYIAAHSYSSVNLDLYSAKETDHCGYRHFKTTPSLSFTFLSTPKAPTALAEINGGTKYACSTSTAGTSITAASGNQIQLTASFASPDKGQAFTGNLYVSSNNGTSYTHYSKAITETTAGTAIAFTQTITVTSGASYRWYATGTLSGTDVAGTAFTLTGTAPTGAPGSAGCRFTYNGVNPSPPAVASAAYPNDGPTTVAAGGSGTLVLTAAMGGDPNAVKSFNYGLDGSGVTDGALHGTGVATSSSFTLSVPLAKVHWGTNTLFVQTVDTVNATSDVATYSFYVQQSAFGAYRPGTAGDIDGDGVPDLVTVDAAGDLRLYRDPETAAVDGDGTALGYGGTVLVPAAHDPAFPGATFSGALITHAGSFIGHNADDLLVEQAGLLYVAENTSSNGTAWTFTPADGVTKPSCGTCANYDSADWSAVTQMVAIPTSPGDRPDLLTLERWNGQTHLWLYTPVGTGQAFDAPTLISSDAADWNWESTQLLAGGSYPGVTGTALVLRDLTTGNLDRIADLAHLAAGAPPVTVLGQGFTADYPLIATTGLPDPNGAWPIWATDDSGSLDLFDATTDPTGATTIADDGEPHPLSAEGWATHQLSLGGTYIAPDTGGFSADGGTAGNSFDGDWTFSATAMANGTLGDGLVNGCSWTAGCASAFGLGQSLVDTGSSPFDNYVTRATPPGGLDNWSASGEVLPVPVDNNGPATSIAFLGAAVAADSDSDSGTASGQATVTFTDGHTQTVTVGFSDWTLDSGSQQPLTGTKIAVTGAYRNDSVDGSQDDSPAYLYATTGTPLRDNGQDLTSAGVQIASVTLPNVDGLHVFGISIN